MDIIIGGTQPVGLKNSRAVESGGQNIEAKVLSVRPARKRMDKPAPGRPERRTAGKPGNDPAGACVLTILIPEGHKIPRDISSGKYRLLLRLAPMGR